jgi:hypothetical protein
MGNGRKGLQVLDTTTLPASARQRSNSLTVLIAEIHELDASVEAAEISLTNGKRERAAKVAEMRDRHGLTQRDIATRLGWSLGKVNGILQFHANPNAAAPFAEQSKAQRERQRNVQPIEHKAVAGAAAPAPRAERPKEATVLCAQRSADLGSAVANNK